MRSGPLLIALVVAGVAALVVRHGSLFDEHPPSGSVAAARSFDWVTDAVAYRDPDYDFSVAVPVGWRSIVAMGESSNDPSQPELGYSVGFEAPRDGDDDVFADYVMIEILPGTESGRFLTDGSRTRSVRIDGLVGQREDLAIDGHRIGDETLDLIVYQAEVRGVGFTLGFYAIGEPSRRELLDDAFELMIRTFELALPPFRVS